MCSYAEDMTAKVLLACEALATCMAGVRALPRVAADVALQDAPLLGSVGAVWAFVQFHRRHQTIP